MTPRPSDFATAGWAYGPTETASAICALEAAGIRVLAHTLHYATMVPHFMTALGGIELRVPAADAEAAREVLASISFSRARGNIWLRAVGGLMLLLWIGMPLPASGLYGVRPIAAAPQRIEP